MKILIILLILALMVYLVYRAAAAESDVELQVKEVEPESVPVSEEVLMPDSAFKKSTKIIGGVFAVLVALLIAAALLM